jgi:AAA+ superfamily predicted ATPase
VTIAPYTDSNEHLWEELHRVDQLVRAQTVRWRLTIGASKPDHLWGMVHVTDAEVDAYLTSEPLPPNRLPTEIERAAQVHVNAAEEQRRRIEARLQATPPEVPLRLRRLTQVLPLSEAERDALLLCLLPELDARYRRLYGYLQDDVSQASPPVELLLQLLHPVAPGTAGRAVVDSGSRLLASRLLVLSDEGQDPRPLAARPVRLDDRIVAYLLGSDAPDRRLEGVLAEAHGPLGWEEVAVELEQLGDLQRLAEWMKRREPSEAVPVLLLEGPQGSGRLTAARSLCTAVGIPLLVVRTDAALHAPAPFDELVGRCVREATLRNAALCWTGCEALLEPPRLHLDRLVEAVESAPGPVVLTTTVPWNPAGQLRSRPLLRYAFPKPAYELRRRLWERCLPPPAAFAEPAPVRAELPDRLANSFRLTHGQMLDAVAAAQALALRRNPMEPRLTPDDLIEACRRQSHRIGVFARRVEPSPSRHFDQLVLPPSNRRQLDELRNRLRHHNSVHSGLGFDARVAPAGGLVAMFTGGSGTGKTMAAELLAGEHGVDLYKVDLSAVVSKYVGETEKHLSELFADGEDANAILFFDEADALFGKRGEVRDARDRWANIEVNHLLQQIEAYSGPVILASNLSQNIDPAFLRRIHVIVDFPFPDAASRLAIWRGMFPPAIERPPDDELRELADRFSLPGGSIRNIVVDAAFRSLADNGHAAPRVTLSHLAIATAREHQKLGKPITKAEFGEDFHSWAQAALRGAAEP